MHIKQILGAALAGALAMTVLAGPAGAKATGPDYKSYKLVHVDGGAKVGTAAVAIGAKRVDAKVTVTRGLPAGKYQARVVNGDLAHPFDAQLKKLCDLVIDAKGKGSCAGGVTIKKFGPHVAINVTPKGEQFPSAIAFAFQL